MVQSLNDGRSIGSPEELQMGATYLAGQMIHYATPFFSTNFSIAKSNIVAEALLEMEDGELDNTMYQTFTRLALGMRIAMRLAINELDNGNCTKPQVMPAYNPSGSSMPILQPCETQLVIAASKLFHKSNLIVGWFMVRESLKAYSGQCTQRFN